ncbi:hypothetical protein [Hyphomicrobium sp. 2TAF46]|uniref:hypothetical protein n=1 Tax=Hyphomicrobium sp. 2TAF46 TaxID=3233019 RepID=UPI003F91F2A4
MAADAHNDDGTGAVRRLRSQRFTRSSRPSEATPARGDDFPIRFSYFPPEEESARARVFSSAAAAEFAETFAERSQAWIDRVSQSFSSLSIRRPTPSEMEISARVGLVLLFLPLAILISPIGLPRTEHLKTAPPFSLVDRLSFGDGLRLVLASQPGSLRSENVDDVAELKIAASTPLAEDPAKPASSPEVPQATVSQLPLLVMDERRWSLPFNSQDYAIADLPTNPQESFRTEVIAASLPEGIESLAAQSDMPVAAPLVQAKRPVERGKRVLAYSRRVPRGNRMPPAVVETVVVEQQEPAFPPLLFFLGGPPPQEEVPPQAKTPPPKSKSWIPNSLQEIFSDEP